MSVMSAAAPPPKVAKVGNCTCHVEAPLHGTWDMDRGDGVGRGTHVLLRVISVLCVFRQTRQDTRHRKLLQSEMFVAMTSRQRSVGGVWARRPRLIVYIVVLYACVSGHP
jgi:hypothetical protein